MKPRKIQALWGPYSRELLYTARTLVRKWLGQITRTSDLHNVDDLEEMFQIMIYRLSNQDMTCPTSVNKTATSGLVTLKAYFDGTIKGKAPSVLIVKTVSEAIQQRSCFKAVQW